MMALRHAIPRVGLRLRGSLVAPAAPSRALWKKAYFESLEIDKQRKLNLLRVSGKGIDSSQLPNDDPEDTSFRLLGGAVVERPPVLSGEMAPMDLEWEAFVKEREPHDCVKIPDRLLPYYEDANSRKRDEEEEKKLYKYCPAKVTLDDKNDNRRSSNRKLQNSLFLIIKYKRSRYQWNFPQAAWEDGETIRQAGERAVAEAVGRRATVQYLGNAPIGVYKYEFDKNRQKNLDFKGNKAFYQHGLYSGGQIELSPALEDFAWVTKAQLVDYFDRDLLKLCDSMLMSQPWAVKSVADYEWDAEKGIFKGHKELQWYMKPQYSFEKRHNKVDWQTGSRAENKARQAEERNQRAQNAPKPE